MTDNTTTLSDKYSSSPTKILVVDDNEINMELIIEFLYDEHVIITKSFDANDSIQKLKSNSYHLVLLDIEMPGKDGWEALREFQKMNIGIPVIAVTAHSGREIHERCIAEGFSDLLVKPFSRKTLYDTIQKKLPKKIQSKNSNIREIPQTDIIQKNNSVTDNSSKLVDISTLELLTKDDPALRNEVLEGFINASKRIIEEIKNSNKTINENNKTLMSDLHKLKNLCPYVTTSKVTKHLTEFEKSIRNNVNNPEINETFINLFDKLLIELSDK